MKEHGFSLIELLVAIIILSILTIALVPMTTGLLRATFIDTPAAMSRDEATYLTNSRFIDALYPMKFAVCTKTDNDKLANNLSSVEIYTSTSFDTNTDITHQLSLESITLSNTGTSISESTGKFIPSLSGINIQSMNFFYGDQTFNAKPYATLAIHYTGLTKDGQSISGTVAMTKLTVPFALPIACFSTTNIGTANQKTINIFFTQPIQENAALTSVTEVENYLYIKCSPSASVDSVALDSSNQKLSITVSGKKVAPQFCIIAFKDSDIIKSYDGYTMSDLIKALGDKLPYIEVSGPCP